MAENETRTEAAPGGARGGPGKLLVALLGLNSLMLAGVLGFLVLRSGARPAPAAGPAEQGAGAQAEHGERKAERTPARGERSGLPGPSIKLADFVVHLRDPDVDRYARVTVEVEVADDKAKEMLTARLPAVRESFIAYLSDRATADLRGSDAIGKAKAELTERLKEKAPDVPFRGLYLTDLVVQ
jgi:flagellar protein FliL